MDAQHYLQSLFLSSKLEIRELKGDYVSILFDKVE